MTATDTATHKVSSWNRQTYQRLQLSLSLGLRRQVFVAVCDDLSLRDRLAGKLQSELGPSLTKMPGEAIVSPNLVSLKLSLTDPNPLGQVTQWLVHHPQSRSLTTIPSFQFLGIEHLTRQSPTAQRLFLRRLQTIERNLSHIDSTLLFWLPRPWFYTIQQSVPEFWQLHTGIFDFEGEPTPLPPVAAFKPEDSRDSLAIEETKASFKEDLQTLLGNEQELQEGSLKIDISDIPILQVPNLQTPNLQTPNLQTPNLQAPNLQTPNLQTPNLQTPNLQLPNENESPATAYLNLGNYYRHLIEQGEVSEENLQIAIGSYEQALQFLEPGSPQISDLLNDLGNLYWMLSRCPGSGENSLSYLEQAIQAYQLALTKLTAEESPHSYAMIQNNLGAAYGDLATHKEPAESLQQSIRAYEEALRYRHADSEPIKYASTQNNLGTAHWNLAQHEAPIENLQAALAAYAEALCYYDKNTDPMSWAMIQNNLGTAYWNLAQYEHPETWLQLAIVAYQDALKYRTAEAAPAACAACQNNLGTAYWHLADRFQNLPERRSEYLQQCIVAYEQVINLAQKLAKNTPPIPVNFDVFATHNNLGLAHYQLATEPRFTLSQELKSAHLQAALHQHVQACTGVAVKSDAYQTALSYIIKTIRTFYREGGISGQNLALSKVPGHLLPEILPRL
jgi:tetratricopeptide (TPR) repeat protein